MAGKKTLVGKALAGLKTAAKRVGAGGTPADARSEKIVEIPEVAVFSELPVARIGVIGGTGVTVTSSPGIIATKRHPAKKQAAAARKSATPTAKKTASKKAGAGKAGAKARKAATKKTRN